MLEGEIMSHTIRVLGWSSVLVVLAVTTALAHLAATKTMPDADAVVTESPQRIQVWFTQDPDPVVSQLALEGPAGEVELGDTTVADEKSLMAVVSGALAPGAYTVSWRTAGDDGHVRRGDFAFTVRGAN